ncbi:MAG: glycosyltransferase [bacterium]
MLSLAGVVVSCVFVFWILAGYPLLLGALARRRGRPVRRGPYLPRVSIIVAVRDGEACIRAKLDSILALEYPPELREIIVASDGSVDATNAIAGTFENHGVSLLALPKAGKAVAINAAIAHASGDVLVFTDVRQRLAAGSLAYLLENLADPDVGAASGHLTILSPSNQEEASIGLYWRYEVWIRSRLSHLDSIFGATGAYYALRRELAVTIPPDSVLDDMHLPLAAFFRGYRLVVDSRAVMYDTPTGLASEFHRKVRTLGGNYQVLCAYPALLGPRNRMWFHFMSYKFGRLLLPFALLLILVCSIGLPSPFASWMLVAQGAFYAAALMDVLVPDRSALRVVTAPIRTFVTLMAATLCALSIFLVPRDQIWLPEPHHDVFTTG